MRCRRLKDNQVRLFVLLVAGVFFAVGLSAVISAEVSANTPETARSAQPVRVNAAQAAGLDAAKPAAHNVVQAVEATAKPKKQKPAAVKTEPAQEEYLLLDLPKDKLPDSKSAASSPSGAKLSGANAPPNRTGTNKSKYLDKTLYTAPSLWRSMGALLIVVCLIAATAWVFKKFTLRNVQHRSGRVLEVLARTALAPKQSMCLVRFGHRLLLLGLSPNQVSCLQALEDPDEIARIVGQLEKDRPNSISTGFDKFLQNESRDYAFSEINAGPENTLDEPLTSRIVPTADEEQDFPQWNSARQELSSLLDKVKALARLKSPY